MKTFSTGKSDTQYGPILDIIGSLLIITFGVTNFLSTFHVDFGGISPNDVRNAPTQSQISDDIRKVVKGTRVVIYNAPFDSKFLPELEDAAEIKCAMRAFAEFNKSKWKSLTNATKIIGYEWEGAHRALADTLALRAVWKHMQ